VHKVIKQISKSSKEENAMHRPKATVITSYANRRLTGGKGKQKVDNSIASNPIASNPIASNPIACDAKRGKQEGQTHTEADADLTPGFVYAWVSNHKNKT
jgi:hypothetical protein